MPQSRVVTSLSVVAAAEQVQEGWLGVVESEPWDAGSQEHLNSPMLSAVRSGASA